MFASIPCVFLNLLLILFIFMNKEFRSLNYSPVVIQALSDIIGPGVANLIFESRVHKKLNDIVSRPNYEDSPHNFETLEKLTRIKGGAACILGLLRMFLSEYTTGPCILATAYNRYASACHPTKQLLTKPVLRAIIISILMFTAFAFLANFSHMIFISLKDYSIRRIFTTLSFVQFCYELSFLEIICEPP